MKRLLLIFALMIPAWFYSCSTKAPVPTPAEVVRQAHDALPKLPEAPFVITPSDPNVKLPVKKSTKAVRRHQVTKAPAKKTEDRLPPQQGPICIFPLNMIPNCTPQAVQ